LSFDLYPQWIIIAIGVGLLYNISRVLERISEQLASLKVDIATRQDAKIERIITQLVEIKVLVKELLPPF
jgi:hypothetical protein